MMASVFLRLLGGESLSGKREMTDYKDLNLNRETLEANIQNFLESNGIHWTAESNR